MEKWNIQYGSDTTEIHPISDELGEYVIADVDPDNNYCPEKREKMARLIAAAPDLLEASKLLFEDWLTLTEQDYNDKDENVRAIDKMVRQSIAKAEKA